MWWGLGGVLRHDRFVDEHLSRELEYANGMYRGLLITFIPGMGAGCHEGTGYEE